MRCTCATAAPTASAVPEIVRSKGATVLVDARIGARVSGLRAGGGERCAARARYGVAFAGVTNSHHFGVAAYHLLPVADAGMVGLAFGNSPAAMPAAGGRRPLFGTNPDRRGVSARRGAHR